MIGDDLQTGEVIRQIQKLWSESVAPSRHVEDDTGAGTNVVDAEVAERIGEPGVFLTIGVGQCYKSSANVSSERRKDPTRNAHVGRSDDACAEPR